MNTRLEMTRKYLPLQLKMVSLIKRRVSVCTQTLRSVQGRAREDHALLHVLSDKYPSVLTVFAEASGRRAWS